VLRVVLHHFLEVVKDSLIRLVTWVLEGLKHTNARRLLLVSHVLGITDGTQGLVVESEVAGVVLHLAQNLLRIILVCVGRSLRQVGVVGLRSHHLVLELENRLRWVVLGAHSLVFLEVLEVHVHSFDH